MSMDMVGQIEAESILLVCGQGPGADGAFLAIGLDPRGEIEKIDPLGSFICLLDGKIFRVLNPTTAPPGTADLLAYDAIGVTDYYRIDNVADVHGIYWGGGEFALPCSATNEIVWLDRYGRRLRTWRAPGENDSCHVNGLWFKDGKWYASAFGLAEAKREVDEKITRELRPGVIFDVETLEPVVEGLDCPHDPMFLDDSWIVCNSRQRQLVKIDPANGHRIAELQLNGWTRGVAITDEHLYVGESAQRHSIGAPGRASIAVVDRKTFALVHRVQLPCVEVNTLRVVPKTLMNGVRRGFHTNPYRDSVLNRLMMFQLPGKQHQALRWTPMDPLDASDCWIQMDVRLMGNAFAVEPLATINVAVRLTNLGGKSLLSAPPNPVYLSYQWRSLSDGGVTEGQREPLGAPIGPGQTLSCALPVSAPAGDGQYELLITCVQEWVCWFHQASPSNAARLDVTVRDSVSATVSEQITDSVSGRIDGVTHTA